MATTQVVKIKVVELGKWGFKTEGSGNYISYSKQIPEGDKAKVVPGAEFEAELYVADSGKEYLNKILAVTPTHTISTSVSTVDTARTKRFTPKFEKKDTATMSKDEWKAKDRSQLIGGLSHDAAALASALVTATAAANDTTEALKVYQALLEGMLKIRDEVK